MERIHQHYSTSHIIILSIHDSEFNQIGMLKAGARTFVKKDMELYELKQAIYAVKEKGYFYTSCLTRKLFQTLYHGTGNGHEFEQFNLNEKEIRFLQLSVSDLTYKEIAKEMNLSPRVIDKIRDYLFFKLDVKNRVTLAIKAINNGLTS